MADLSPSKAAKRQKILQAARNIFIRNGFRASMGDVAKAAGVSPRTIFNYFATKEELFEALVVPTGPVYPGLEVSVGPDVSSSLLDFARRYAAVMTGPQVVLNYRLLRGSPMASIENAYAIQRADFIRVRDTLADYLSGLVAAGTLKPVNTAFAAERFMSAALGVSRLAVSLGITPTDTDRDAYLADMVAAFLDGVRP